MENTSRIGVRLKSLWPSRIQLNENWSLITKVEGKELKTTHRGTKKILRA